MNMNLLTIVTVSLPRCKHEDVGGKPEELQGHLCVLVSKASVSGLGSIRLLQRPWKGFCSQSLQGIGCSLGFVVVFVETLHLSWFPVGDILFQFLLGF